jgi:hypothetical protein
MFCDSCNEVACESCCEEGTHSNKLHATVPITESYLRKFKDLNSFVSKDLMVKHEKLLKQVAVLERISEDLKSNKDEIEKEIRNEYTRIIENLKREEGKKLSVITHETNIIQKELNKINEIAIFLKEMDTDSPDLIKFMEHYKEYRETAEKCYIKEIKSKVLHL